MTCEQSISTVCHGKQEVVTQMPAGGQVKHLPLLEIKKKKTRRKRPMTRVYAYRLWMKN